MTKLEMVIKGLECCIEPTTHSCDYLCPYRDKYQQEGYEKCMGALLPDTIALLKEQEAKIEQLNRFVNGFSRDAMPVVRCKDCKKRFTKYCILFSYHTQRLENWHCADGVKKE